MDESEERGVSRRRFLSLVALTAAGAAAASTLPAAGEAASALAGSTEASGEAAPPGPEPMSWPARRRLMLRAHEDVVLHGTEEG